MMQVVVACALWSAATCRSTRQEINSIISRCGGENYRDTALPKSE
jgi:hypothetical protein